jgi:hypothetical protein
MRVLNTVIYTDKVSEVRKFYETHFVYPTDTGEPNSFGVLFYAEAKITFVDAKSAGVEPSRNVLLRLTTAYPIIERARLIAAGVNCGEMVVENWGSFYGQAVQYFTVTDPSGTRIQMFEDHYGEEKQLMTTGDGTGTKKVQEREQES